MVMSVPALTVLCVVLGLRPDRGHPFDASSELVRDRVHGVWVVGCELRVAL